MDTSETGELARLAKQLGDVLSTSVTDDTGDVEARAFHVQRPGKPDIVVAGSVASSKVVAMLVPSESATVGMAAVRVLANERGDQLKPGKIVSLPAGAQGSRSVRGSTGSFAMATRGSRSMATAYPMGERATIPIPPPSPPPLSPCAPRSCC